MQKLVDIGARGRVAVASRKMQGLLFVAAILIGLTAPIAVLGRAAMALTFVPGFLLLLGWVLRFEATNLWRSARKSSFLRIILVLTIVAASFLPFSIDLPRSAAVLARTSALVFGAWIVVWVLQREIILARGAWAGLGSGSAAASVYALASIHVIGHPIWPLDPGKPGPEGVALAFKAYSSVAALLAVLFVWRTISASSWPSRLAWAVNAMLCLAVVVSNDADVSRSALIGIAVAATVALLVPLFGMLPNHASRWGASLTVVLVFLCGFFLLCSILAEVVGENPVPSVLPLGLLDAHRQIIWGFAWNLFMERPLQGWGLDTSNLTPGASNVVPGWNVEFIPAHTHNFVLELLVDAGGVLSVLLLAAILFVALQQIREILRGQSSDLAALLVQAAFWSASFSNFSIWSFWWLLAFACVLIGAKAVNR